MELTTPFDNKDKSNTRIDEAAEEQLKKAPILATPLTIRILALPSDDIALMVLKDEQDQIKAKMIVGSSTLKQLQEDLNELFRDDPK